MVDVAIATLQACPADTHGHGDTLAPSSHGIALGLARVEGVLAMPVLVPLAVPAVGVCASTLVLPVALVLHPGTEVAVITTLASVESLTPAGAGVAVALGGTLLGLPLFRSLLALTLTRLRIGLALLLGGLVPALVTTWGHPDGGRHSDTLASSTHSITLGSAPRERPPAMPVLVLLP